MRPCLSILLAACSFHAGPQRPPPTPGSLTLAVEPLVVGDTAIATVSGATAGSAVYLGASPQTPPGVGPCLRFAGGLCLDLVNPILLGTAVADANGVATVPLDVPSHLTVGLDVTLQAVSIEGPGGTDSASSPPAVFILEAPIVDVDLDGYSADEDCDDDDPARNPGALETCNGIDDDCDGEVDAPGLITSHGQNHASLGAAISGGGSILLCRGTYMAHDLQLQQDLRGIDGSDATIIDAGGLGQVMTVADAWTDIEGITLRGGTGAVGGLTVRGDSRVALRDVVIEDNHGTTAGGLSIAGASSSLVFPKVYAYDSVIRRNHGGTYGAGGVRVSTGVLRGTRLTITENTTDYHGGAIRMEGLQAVERMVELVDSEVTRNTAGGLGGGLYMGSIGTQPWQDPIFVESRRTFWGQGASVNLPQDAYLDRTDNSYNFSQPSYVECTWGVCY